MALKPHHTLQRFRACATICGAASDHLEKLLKELSLRRAVSPLNAEQSSVCSRQLHFPAKNFPRMLYHSPCSRLSWYQWGIDCIGPSIPKSLRAIIFFELQTSLTLASRNSSSLLPWPVFGFVVFHILFIYCVWMHAQWRKSHTPPQVPMEVRVSLQLAAGFCFHSEGWKQSLNSGMSALQEALCLLTGLAGPAVSFD